MAIETNLIAYWECSSVNSTIGAYPATFSGGTTVGVGTGKFGDSWEFAAIADRASLATPVPLTSGGWSVSAWGFNLRPDTNYRALVSNGGGGVPPYGAYHFITEITSALAGVFCGGPAFTFFSTGATLLSVAYAGWHHYAAVFNGTTVVLYVDGAAFGVAVTPASWAGSHQIETIGGSYYATEGFAERLDDVAAWTRPLSAAEILTIYNAGVAGNSLASLIPIETNLVSYWKFDSNVLDAGGSDNGTGTGGLAYAASMTGFSNAIDCAGTDYVSYGTPAYGTNSLTMSMWIKPDGITGVYQNIWHNRTGTYVGWSIMVDGWGAGPGPNHYLSEVSSAGGGGPYSDIRSTAAASAGSWIHFAVVIDRSSNTQRMYIDGVLQSHGSDVASISGMGSFTNSTLYTGSSAGGSIWQGEMDDVTWWTRALTPAEITAIYTAGAAASPFSSLLPHARLEGMWSSVVHSADIPASARLEGMWSSVVHSSSTPPSARLEGMWSSVVHSADTPPSARLEGMWTSIVHTDIVAPSGGSPTSQGKSMQGGGSQGGNLEGDT